MPRFYRYADLVISSHLILPTLPLACGPADLSYRDSSPVAGLSGRLIRRYSLDDGDWLQIWESGELTSYVFPGIATFTIDVRSGVIRGHPEPSTSSRTMRHLLLDQVLPLHMVSQGRHVLHGSCVAVDTAVGPRALMFLGASGAGKSSTATGCWLAGAALLADDFALVSPSGDTMNVVPTNMGVRLWEDVADSLGSEWAGEPVADYTSKARVQLRGAYESPSATPVQIGAVVSLASRVPAAAHVRLESVRPADALMQVVEHSYRIDMTSASANADLFAQAARLVEDVPVFRVGLPQDLSQLESTCRELLRLLGDRLAGGDAEPPVR